ncbi:aldehyde dehydrogenase family protein [Streptomyces silvisoli]|uniref:Aldehyde dehydrogenase family protein n=1 Tax=Streptomyces silvisoli TaxID=3034235 RepID=A0ABT5ZS54_9ACTN|nr:aldehyde dehydrogenase family protein [Streptomyces silvisoli]MDF3292662.1 aldehyde dehydrogenase family protein [Streptomyces silvisoli]
MTIPMTAGGRPLTIGQTIPVVDPATGKVAAQAPACSAEQLASTVRAAVSAFAPWAARPLEERAEYLRRCSELLGEHTDEIAELLTTEQGKPLAQARAEANLSASWFADTAALRLSAESLVDEDATSVMMRRTPLGVVAAIAPFNFPLILSACKIAPALLAGNTVVVKPSPLTPLATLRMVQVLAEVLPGGVLNAVSGRPELGPALTGHPEIALISFTGSIPVGRAIAASAGLRRVVLELGGNDPAIVLPGADPEIVAPELFARSMVNSGQFCAAIKRVYVPRRQHDELAERLGELARRARMGDGHDPLTEYGPLTSEAQVSRVAAMVEEAVSGGARVVAQSGAPLDTGFFFPATVVSDLPPATRLEREEQFAPVIPVLAYDDPAEAVHSANATEYGLGASLWGDPELAEDLASGIDAGTVWINTHGDLRHDVPFGGSRNSGLGVEYGYWGLLEYTRIAVTHRARTAR